MFSRALRPACKHAGPSGRATYFTRRTKLVIPPAIEGTYEDILKLQEEIDACVYERDDLRVKTLPLQVQDNRLRALYDKENWKLREFNEWIARQDPDWQPPPRLPHARKKRNKVLREMAIAEARKKRALQAANKEQQSELDEYDAALSESVRSAETNEPGGEAKRTSRDGVLDSPSSFDTAFESPKAPESAPESSKPSAQSVPPPPSAEVAQQDRPSA